MFEYAILENDKKVNKTIEDESSIVNKITGLYESLNQARSRNLQQAKELKKEVFFASKSEKKNDWHSDIKAQKVYMYYMTLLAFVWKNVYSDISNMYNVSGESSELENQANLQKSYLNYVFEQMHYAEIFNKIIENSLLYGELISYSCWKTKLKPVRRPITTLIQENQDNPAKLEELEQALLSGQEYFIDYKEEYNNPYVYDVNPAMFAFDTSVEDFDAAAKILKTFKTPQSILNNKLYKISDECREYLKHSTTGFDTTAGDQSDEILNHTNKNGNSVEVMEYFGDFKLNNGDLLTNKYIVIVADRFLVCFDDNPAVINPFTFKCLIENPDTKRGISPVYSTVSLAQTQEQMINRSVDIQTLEANPPAFTDEEFLEDDVLDIEPGKIFKSKSFKDINLQFMNFSNKDYMGYVSFLSDTMSEISGIFPNMVGQEEQTKKTATEIQTKVQGQTTRLAMLIDIIYEGFIIPVVENVAELLANFKYGQEQIYQPEKNRTLIIDDSIRQGEYKYTYTDRAALEDKQTKAKEYAQIFQQFGQFLPLDVQKIFIWFCGQMGIENPERFIQQQQQIPVEIQQQLMNNPQFAQMVQNFGQQTPEING